MNEITYTISRNADIFNVHTANLNVDEQDRSVICTASSSLLWFRMDKLSKKYNAKGYAVLFEIG